MLLAGAVPVTGPLDSNAQPSAVAVSGALDQAAVDINFVRPDSPATALHMAASHDLADIAAHLVQSGARLEIRSPKNGRTPLLTAASARATRTAIELLRLGADSRTRDGQGYSALDYAGQWALPWREMVPESVKATLYRS